MRSLILTCGSIVWWFLEAAVDLITFMFAVLRDLFAPVFVACGVLLTAVALPTLAYTAAICLIFWGAAALLLGAPADPVFGARLVLWAWGCMCGVICVVCYDLAFVRIGRVLQDAAQEADRAYTREAAVYLRRLDDQHLAVYTRSDVFVLRWVLAVVLAAVICAGMLVLRQRLLAG